MLKFQRIIQTVDLHTGGEPFRIVTSGLPPLPGRTILAKRRHMAAHRDHIRTFLMLEPRGHAGMYGAIVTEPEGEDGDLGVLFMHNEGYSTMCGHGVIALTKAVLELGLAEPKGGPDELRIDAPCGRIRARAEMEEGRVGQVSFRNVPSFVYQRDIEIQVDGIGPVRMDIAYGGAFYVYVEAEKLGARVVPEQIDRLTALGREIKLKAMEKYPVVHPLEEDLGFIYGTIIMAPYEETASGLVSKNVCIFADGQIDRSPTGSGTSGRLALAHDQGLIGPGQTLVNKSIIDTVFKGRIIGPDKAGERPALATEVSGSAQIMGFHQFVLEPDDPLALGFRLGGG